MKDTQQIVYELTKMDKLTTENTQLTVVSGVSIVLNLVLIYVIVKRLIRRNK